METLITFETAKLAKEKKFNIDVNYLISQYTKDNSINFSERVDYDNYNHKNWNNDNRVCLFSRPTQSLLQKWLREEKDTDILIESIGGKNGYYVRLQYVDSGDFILSTENYLSYEEAVEQGLNLSLKLIK